MTEMFSTPSEDRQKIPDVAWGVLAAGFLLGIVMRHMFRDYTTTDTFTFLLPWYNAYLTNGVLGLGKTITNYTPFYSYMLYAVTWFDGWLKPLYLIKMITFAFEFGCAVLAYRIVRVAGGSAVACGIGFVAIWAAPMTLFNAALWGQADALWTFFCLLAVYQFCRANPLAALIAFGVAFSVKAQAAFFGPLILAYVINGRIGWPYLAAIPGIYLLIAAPSLLLGQPLQDVLGVYTNQARTFNELSKNAANLWIFVSDVHYRIGSAIGLVAATLAGLVFAFRVGRSASALSPRVIVMAAALTLLLMPFILPKMHERYFYGFEHMSIVLACIDPRLVLVAVASQVAGFLSYLVFDRDIAAGLLPAALINTALVVFLTWKLNNELSGHARPPDGRVSAS